MEFDWVRGCGLGWFVGPKFLLCDGLGWVGSVVWWVGLSWAKEIGPTDNSACTYMFAVACTPHMHIVFSISEITHEQRTCAMCVTL